jgi:hypothetical protein
MGELKGEFGSCTLKYLFLKRADAKALAGLLNERGG